MFKQLTIDIQEIIILVNYVWYQLFTKKPSNRKSIAERRRNPFNSNILLETQIWSIMTKNKIEVESPAGTMISFIAMSKYVELD